MLLNFDPQPHHSTLIGVMAPALRATGQDWPMQKLEGFLGHAFLFSMNPDGGGVWQAGNYEWSHVFDMLKYFKLDAIDASLKGANRVSPEEFQSLKRSAREKVRASLDQGIPAVGWQFLSVEDRDAGRGAFLWSLIVGYRFAADEYVVRHRNAGEYTVRWDGIGHTDPINWLSVLLFKRPDGPFDDMAHRIAIRNAVAISEGQRPGADAAAHGKAAWDMWLDAFRSGKVNVAEVGNHARFLIGARSAAAAYLRDIVASMPPAGRESILAAASSYDEVVESLRHLAGDVSDLAQAAQSLELAVAKERSALNSLRLAIADA